MRPSWLIFAVVFAAFGMIRDLHGQDALLWLVLSGIALILYHVDRGTP